MKKALKVVLGTVAALLVVVAAAAAYVQLSGLPTYPGAGPRP